MEEGKIQEIREIIEREIEKTSSLIEEYKELTKPIAPENAIGRVSRMDAINNKSVNEAALRQAESKLSKLKEVYDKVGTNDFGLCASCHKPIPLGRLLLMPHSRFCVSCAR